MKLLEIQKKYINSKPFKISLIKGLSNSGKSIAAYYRIINLINNYAFDGKDSILFINKNKNDLHLNKLEYEKVDNDEKYTFLSLLSTDKQPEFMQFNDLLKDKKNYSLVGNKTKLLILKNIINNNKFLNCKKINMDNIYLLLQEIKYMKINNCFHIDKYNELSKTPLKLRKNSNSRTDMFRLFKLYNDTLKNDFYYDEEDRILYSINNNKRRYTHIFIDNAEQFSKLELEYILGLSNDSTYSTINVIVDTDKGENIYSNLVKKGRVYAKRVFDKSKKIYNFKTDVSKRVQVVHNNLEIKNIDKYNFIDLKHKNEFEFYIDHTNNVEKVIGESEEVYNEEELTKIPVFNDIAAGAPILINPSIEGGFSLPKYWVKGSNQKFILKVKGDSMIDANINDGDYVVIEQNHAPDNGEIVAVNIEGSATLKRLKILEDKILLLPENEKYKPIVIERNDEFYILGKAIGVISEK